MKFRRKIRNRHLKYHWVASLLAILSLNLGVGCSGDDPKEMTIDPSEGSFTVEEFDTAWREIGGEMSGPVLRSKLNVKEPKESVVVGIKYRREQEEAIQIAVKRARKVNAEKEKEKEPAPAPETNDGP